MNFFRLRVINTVLFFLIGTLIGFILKERFMPSKPAAAAPRYQPEYSARADEAANPAVQPDTASEAEEAPEPEPEPAPKPVQEERKPEPVKPPRPAPAMIEASVLPPEPAARETTGPAVVKGAQDDFFSAPQDYIGKDLELELQMITAKRTQRGWRLNFIYSGSGKQVDYLYVDDSEILGDAPDLRIGYVYRLRFHCSKGETASGNTLTLITATGDKAAWATGLSAIE